MESMGTKASIFKTVVKVTMYFLLIFFIFYIGTKSYYFGKALFTDAGRDKAPGKDITVTVTNGASDNDVAAELVRTGVVESKLVFSVQCIMYDADFKAGTYTVNTSSSPEDIIQVLSAGNENDTAKNNAE